MNIANKWLLFGCLCSRTAFQIIFRAHKDSPITILLAQMTMFIKYSVYYHKIVACFIEKPTPWKLKFIAGGWIFYILFISVEFHLLFIILNFSWSLDYISLLRRIILYRNKCMHRLHQ